jgi:glutathione S-transferase
MIELHYYPDNASQFPHMLLHELGCPFALQLVDRDHDAQHSAAYLKLNPNGKIPVLVDDGQVIFETGAIGLHLADKFPEAGLAPPPGSPDRGAYYKWMVFMACVPQAEYRSWFYPREFVDDPALAPHVRSAANLRLMGVFGRIAAQLGAGPWLLGERFSAADLYLLMMTRWGRLLPKRPASVFPEIAAHGARVLARPAVQATFAAEGVAGPFV